MLPDKQSGNAIMQMQWEIVEDGGKDWAVGTYMLPECSSPSGTRSKRDDCHYKSDAINEKVAQITLVSPKDNT
jgi:hypothetical protein